MPLIGERAVLNALAELRVTASQRVKAEYIRGLSNIVTGTPVDTGEARNNWFLSIGAPFSLVASRGDSSSGSGSISSINTMPDFVLDKKIYFSNNRPWIIPLEYGGYPAGDNTTNGFSNQAPGGWVRAELIRMGNRIGRI